MTSLQVTSGGGYGCFGRKCSHDRFVASGVMPETTYTLAIVQGTARATMSQ